MQGNEIYFFINLKANHYRRNK